MMCSYKIVTPPTNTRVFLYEFSNELTLFSYSNVLFYLLWFLILEEEKTGKSVSK